MIGTTLVALALAASASANAGALARTSAGRPGALDRSFSGNGFAHATTRVPISVDVARAVLVEANGDIVAAGDSNIGTQKSAIALARYDAAGSLDQSFGDGGKTLTPIPGDVRVDSAVLQSSGKIVVAGTSQGDFLLARYDTDGSLDTTFGQDGLVTTDFGGTDELAALLLTGGDGLVAVGRSGADVALARYGANGVPDGSFGTGGKTVADVGATAGALGAALTPNSEIAVTADLTSKPEVALFSASGQIDPAFGTGGTQTIDVNGGAHALGVQADGRIVVAGNLRTCDACLDRDFFARLHGDGSLDPSFGTDGIFTPDPPQGEAIYPINIAFQPDGKIVLAGSRVARLNADGTFDQGFGSDGATGCDASGQITHAVALDGGDVVTGLGDAHGDFQVCGFQSDGQLDDSFGSGGRVTTDFQNPFRRFARSYPSSVLTADQGAVFVGATAQVDESTPNSLETAYATATKFTSNGGRDQAFGNNGTAIGAQPSSFIQLSSTNVAIVRQPDGRVLTISLDGNDYQTAVITRYGTNGEVDDSYGVGGTVRVASFAPSGAALAPDGGLLVAGFSGGNNGDPAVLRLAPDGSVETSFGSAGIATLPKLSYPRTVTVRPSGRILVAGTAFDVAALTPTGGAISGFGRNGIATVAFARGRYAPSARGLAVGAGGKPVLLGDNPNLRPVLVRYRGDGSLDRSFGGDGSKIIKASKFGRFEAVSVLDDGGGLIVVGRESSKILLVRLTRTGRLDSSFGHDGLVAHLWPGGNPTAASLAPNGRIVVAGEGKSGRTLVARFFR